MHTAEIPPRTTVAKVAEWLRRYGLAECVGIACALLGSFATRKLTRSAVAAAYGGAWSETVGYAAAIVVRDFLTASRTAQAAGRAMTPREGGGVIMELIAEFGPAGILDTFITRPFAMGIGVRFLGPVRGLIAGKLAADIFFYLPVIFMYERRRGVRSERI